MPFRTFALLAVYVFSSSVIFGQGTPAASNGLTLPAGCGELNLAAIAENAIRVRCGAPHAAPLPELVYTHIEPVATEVGSDTHSNWIKTSAIKATIEKQTGIIRFFNARGELLTEELPDGRRWTKGNQSKSIGVAEVRYKLEPGEHLYGSGQFQDGFLDIARLPRKLVQLNSQISVPFFLSNRGYGLLWHEYGMTELNQPDHTLALKEGGSGQSVSVDVTTSAGTQRQRRASKLFTGSFAASGEGEYAIVLDSGRTMTDRYHLEIDGKPVIEFDNSWLPGTTSTITHLGAGTHQVTVNANAADHPVIDWGPARNETRLRAFDTPQVDYTVFAGTPDSVIASYRALTGEAPLFPKWAFGFIQCKERYHSAAELVDAVKQFREDKLPLDVIVQDWQYWGKYGWNAMRFDESGYPDPAKMVQDLHDQHAHLMVSVWSRFDAKSEVGKQFQDNNYFVPGTSWVDFFNPAAAKLYWQNFSARMRSLGIDAWWLDATEPENDDLNGRSTYAGPGDEFRLVYPLLVTRTVYDGMRQDSPERRAMILTRSAFLGEQRYAVATWSGDVGNGWDTLKRQVTAGLGFMASGMPYWTTDTGGFFRPGNGQYTDPAYHERFLRWFEFSVFTPLLRVHGYQTNTEPWNYGPEMVQQERQLLDLRYQLIFYIYSQSAAVTFQGGTMMRPLVMDFPNDEKALQQKYEYMFGPSFLVAPVLEPGVVSAHVYAPRVQGGWYDWWTDNHLQGGADATLDAPLEEIPLLVRAGSVIPLAPVQQYVGQDTNPEIQLRVYPGANGILMLYDDDGLTYNYERAQRSVTMISWDDHRRVLTIADRQGSYQGMPAERRFHVRYMAPRSLQEKEVTYDGHKIQVRF